MKAVSFVTIPRRITGDEELIVISKKELGKLVSEKEPTVFSVLKLAKEAKRLYNQGKLRQIKSFRELR